MNITLTYEKKSLSCDLEDRERLRLYSVPTEYSDDGLYLAAWKSGELEPVPACRCTEAVLLADLECNAEGDALIEHMLAKGVTYAQD